MRSLIIPEIGDEFVLAEDWTFPLYVEYRNESLAAAIGYKMSICKSNGEHRQVWVPMETNEMPSAPLLTYPNKENYNKKNLLGIRYGGFDYDSYNEACRKVQNESKEWQDFLKEQERVNNLIDEVGTEILSVSFKAGTSIKVDRIYIRKGKSDFSSITWYVKGLDEAIIPARYNWQKPKKVKTPRFWTKLEDVNRIKVV